MQRKDEEIEWFYLQKEGKAPSTFRLEIDQLREDNKRLLAMLHTTKEFKQFSGYVEDCGGEVRILERGQGKDEPYNNQSRPDQRTRSSSKTRARSSSKPRGTKQSIDSNYSMV